MSCLFMSSKKYCTNCGKPIKGDINYCTNCGNSLLSTELQCDNSHINNEIVINNKNPWLAALLSFFYYAWDNFIMDKY